MGKSRLVQEFAREIGARRDGAARPLPALRRGHHLLAAGRDRPRDRPRRRSRRRRAVERSDRRAARRRGEGRPDRRAVSEALGLGGAGGRRARRRSGPSARSSRRSREPAARRRVRRPPLGGADVPRPDRARRRITRATRRSCSSASPDPSCSTAAPGWGGGKRKATSILARAAAARPMPRADREPARPRAAPRGGRDTDRRRGRGQRALRRGAARDAGRRQALSAEDGRWVVAEDLAELPVPHDDQRAPRRATRRLARPRSALCS